MSKITQCKNPIATILVTIFIINTVHGQFSSNIFLNGYYRNAIDLQPNESQFLNNKILPDNNNIFLNHAIISRQAQPFSGPQYLPPKEYIKCNNGQICVKKNVCQNGFFTNNYGDLIQNCDAETDICCTYRPPPTTRPITTTTTTTTTTERPYQICSSDSDCVSSRNCRNGEITISNYVKTSTKNRCYSPEICCRLPSTVLTEDGYIFNVPEKMFPLPTQRPKTTFIPTSNNEYLPPSENEIPTRPEVTYRPQPSSLQPQLTSYRPVQTIPYKPIPQQSTQPPRKLQPSTYYPQPTPGRPQQTTIRSQTRLTRPPTPYRPPSTIATTKTTTTTTTTSRPYRPEASNQIPLRGEDQLSPQIFPTPTARPKPQIPSRPNFIDNQPAPITPSKCAAALVCTDITYCNAIGVISETPVEMSPAQAAFRVPLTDCLIPNSNELGKCCRDPNYVDPWPVNLNGYCAQRNKNTKPQGIKDLDANFAEIPWQAMILKESTKSLLCGGTILGSDIVLTSATCVAGESKQDIRVKGGEWELGSDDEPMPFQLLNANEINIHPEYNPSTGENDLAMIKLNQPFQFATHIGPLCISDQDPSPTEQCVTSGWGKPALKIHEQGAIMHRTQATAVARSECNASDNEVCAATKFDSCAFDVGSALACGTGTNIVLKGIYSRENQCGENEIVKFIKPDIKWINTAFTQRNRPLLLQQ